MDRQFLDKNSFNESDNVQDKAEVILQDLDMLNDVSKQIESIKQKLERFPVYLFDEAASQRLEILNRSFNQFEFEILSVEQQYCDDTGSLPFDLNNAIAKIHTKIWAFETEIKTLETYLYRKC